MKDKDTNIIRDGIISILNNGAFANFDSTVKSSILGEFAKREMWEPLMSASEYINPKESMKSLNNLTFQEWLLTNPDKRAFEIWLKMRDRQKKDGTYSLICYENSASLIIYANLLERLDFLDKEEWTGCIYGDVLAKAGLHLEMNEFSDNAKKKLKNYREYIKGSGLSNPAFNSINLAALRGYVKLIRRAKEMIEASSIPYINFKNLPTNYIIGSDSADIDPLMEIMKEVFHEEGKCDDMMYALFNSAIILANKKQLESIWQNLSETNKNSFLTSNHHKIALRNALKFDRADIAQYLYSMKNDSKFFSDKGILPTSALWECISNGTLESVKFVLEKRPELLEETDWVYRSKNGRKKGTALTLAIVKSKIEIANLLRSYGASTASLKKLMSYTPFIEDNEVNNENKIFIRAEKFLLENVVSQKHDNLKDKNNSYLSAL